jgi:hypothetical protein
MTTETHPSDDITTFFRVSVRNMDDGLLATPLLPTAADVLAWVAAHPAVTEWRVKGSLATRPGSAWRAEGKTGHRYFEDGLTPRQLAEHFALAGH